MIFSLKPKRGLGLIGIKVYTSNISAGIHRDETSMENQETGKMTRRQAGWQSAGSGGPRCISTSWSRFPEPPGACAWLFNPDPEDSCDSCTGQLFAWGPSSSALCKDAFLLASAAHELPKQQQSKNLKGCQNENASITSFPCLIPWLPKQGGKDSQPQLEFTAHTFLTFCSKWTCPSTARHTWKVQRKKAPLFHSFLPLNYPVLNHSLVVFDIFKLHLAPVSYTVIEYHLIKASVCFSLEG